MYKLDTDRIIGEQENPKFETQWKNQPLVLKIENTGTEVVKNLELFGAYKNRHKKNFGLPEAIVVETGIPGVEYGELLAESEQTPFDINSTIITSTSVDNLPEWGEKIHVISSDSFGNGANKGMETDRPDMYFEEAPSGVIDKHYKISGYSRLVIPQILPGTSITISMFQMNNIYSFISKKEVEHDWNHTDTVARMKEGIKNGIVIKLRNEKKCPIIINIENTSDEKKEAVLFDANKRRGVKNYDNPEGIEITYGMKDTTYDAFLAKSIWLKLNIYKVELVSSKEQENTVITFAEYNYSTGDIAASSFVFDKLGKILVAKTNDSYVDAMSNVSIDIEPKTKISLRFFPVDIKHKKITAVPQPKPKEQPKKEMTFLEFLKGLFLYGIWHRIFPIKEYTVVKDLETLAEVGHGSGKIWVSPKFETLDKKAQYFLISHLRAMYGLIESKHGSDYEARYFMADGIALEKLRKKYPEMQPKEILTTILTIFKELPPTDLTRYRLSAIENTFKVRFQVGL